MPQPTDDLANIHQRPVQLLRDLIRFDTTNPPGREADCVAYVRHVLTQGGFETSLLARDPQRPNLITCLRGQGNAPPLLLHGHVDVRPTEGQKWQHPPFEGRVVDGCVWGRGALDMKGGVAMMLAAMLRAKAEGLTPQGDIILAVLSDEEQGSEYGAKYLVENHAERFKGVRYAIGEFGGFTFDVGGRRLYLIQIAEKRFCLIKVTMNGQGGHASLRVREGVMAQLARVLAKLGERSLPVHVIPVTRQSIDALASAVSLPSSFILRQLLTPKLTGVLLRMLGARGQAIEPMFRNMANVYAVQGTAIPSQVVLLVSVYLLPGYDPGDVVAELRKLTGDQAELEVVAVGPPSREPDMGLFDTLAGLLRSADPEGTPVPYLQPAVTDARFFGQLGIQTYGFTPMTLPSDLKFWQLVHAADERIPTEAVEFGTDAIYRLLQCYHCH